MPKKPFAQLATRQKKKIYKVCLEMLANNGYNNTSVKMLTRRLKVADGYLHYYFEGKEDLMKWAVETGLDQWISHFQHHVAVADCCDLFELFKSTILQMLRFTREHRDLFAAYVRVVNEPNMPLADYLAEKISWIDKLYIDVIETEIAAGRLRSDVPAPLVAMVMDVLNTRLQEFIFNTALDPIGLSRMDETELGETIDKLISLLRDGVGAPGARQRAATA